ncbi:MAG: hypothetical protein HEQ33_19040 [Dolichospermum sp. WA123]|nr:hypothetical protein [Dolichospermum sp. WA123]
MSRDLATYSANLIGTALPIICSKSVFEPELVRGYTYKMRSYVNKYYKTYGSNLLFAGKLVNKIVKNKLKKS